jgi:hypothetical protein
LKNFPNVTALQNTFHLFVDTVISPVGAEMSLYSALISTSPSGMINTAVAEWLSVFSVKSSAVLPAHRSNAIPCAAPAAVIVTMSPAAYSPEPVPLPTIT